MTALILKNQLTTLQNELLEAQDLLQSMQDDPAAHFADEMKESYNDMLNEVYAEQFEAFPFELGDPCDWIEKNEPTDYRVGFSDFDFDCSTQDLYIDLEDQIEGLEAEKENIEEEIEELEAEEE